jgi:hypothetical protein
MANETTTFHFSANVYSVILLLALEYEVTWTTHHELLPNIPNFTEAIRLTKPRVIQHYFKCSWQIVILWHSRFSLYIWSYAPLFQSWAKPLQMWVSYGMGCRVSILSPADLTSLASRGIAGSLLRWTVAIQSIYFANRPRTSIRFCTLTFLCIFLDSSQEI